MGLIGSIAGLGASTIGGIFASKAMNKGYRQQQDMFNQRLTDIKAHRDNVYYQDPTQTAANQAAVTQAREALAENAEELKNAAAIGGGPDLSAISKKNAAKAIAGMMQQQAVQGEAQKEAAWNAADSQVDAFSKYLADSKLQQQQGKAQAISQAAGGLANAANLLPV